MKATDLVGQVFGRLRVIARAGSTERTPRRPLWLCRCACGAAPVVLAASLRAGRTQSCGCLRAELARATVALARAQLRAPARPGRRRPASGASLDSASTAVARSSSPDDLFYGHWLEVRLEPDLSAQTVEVAGVQKGS